MSLPEGVTEAQVVKVEPGDVVVYKVGDGLYEGVYPAIEEWHKQTFGEDVRALVVEPDSLDLEVIRPCTTSP